MLFKVEPWLLPLRLPVSRNVKPPAQPAWFSKAPFSFSWPKLWDLLGGRLTLQFRLKQSVIEKGVRVRIAGCDCILGLTAILVGWHAALQTVH
jgi:hypothetical protein